MALLPGVLLLALAFLLYANAIDNPYIIDDSMMVLAHPALTQPGGFWHIWTHGFWEGVAQDPNLYRPVTVLSYWAHGVVTGLGHVPVRCVNIALLGLCAWAGGLLASRFINPAAAWVAAAIWLALPSNTESINHTVARADLLALLGILLFLLIQQGAAARGGWTPARMASAGLAALMAVGAKETGLLVLPCALVQAWVLMSKLQEAPKAGLKAVEASQAKRFLKQTAALAGGAAGVYLAARLFVVGLGAAYAQDTMDLTGNPLRVVGWEDRLGPGLSVMFWYFMQAVWPATTFNHTPGALPDSRDLGALLGCVTGWVLVGATVRGLQRRAWYCVPGTLALGSLIMLSNILLPIGVYAANRLTPGVTMGFWLLFAAGLDVLVMRKMDARHGRVVVPMAGALVIAIFGVRTVMANTEWASLQERMKADAEAQPDNPIALYNLGTSFMEAGDFAQASRELERAVHLAPKSAQARMNLAGARLLSREYPAAAEQYEAVLALDPPAVMAFRVKAATALGVIAIGDERYDDAEKYLMKALVLAPDDTDALFNLGVVCGKTKRYAEAMTAFNRVIQLSPGHRRAIAGKAQLEKFLGQGKGQER